MASYEEQLETFGTANCEQCDLLMCSVVLAMPPPFGSSANFPVSRSLPHFPRACPPRHLGASGKMIDEEEEKKKRSRSSRSSKLHGTTPTPAPHPATSSASAAAAPADGTPPQTFKAQPQLRVVGFQVGSGAAPSSSPSGHVLSLLGRETCRGHLHSPLGVCVT